MRWPAGATLQAGSSKYDDCANLPVTGLQQNSLFKSLSLGWWLSVRLAGG